MFVFKSNFGMLSRLASTTNFHLFVASQDGWLIRELEAGVPSACGNAGAAVLRQPS